MLSTATVIWTVPFLALHTKGLGLQGASGLQMGDYIQQVLCFDEERERKANGIEEECSVQQATVNSFCVALLLIHSPFTTCQLQPLFMAVLPPFHHVTFNPTFKILPLISIENFYRTIKCSEYSLKMYLFIFFRILVRM